MLRRNLKDKMLAGVIAGLADYLDRDVSLLRILAVLLAVCSVGTAVLVYLLAALIIPAG